MVAKMQGDKSASQSSMELYDPWISGPLCISCSSLCSVAEEQNQNRKPEPSELFFRNPKPEPERCPSVKQSPSEPKTATVRTVLCTNRNRTDPGPPCLLPHVFRCHRASRYTARIRGQTNRKGVAIGGHRSTSCPVEAIIL